MKFRYVLVVVAGLIITILVFGVGSIASYQPNHYKFLGSNAPKKVVLEPDRIGWVGMEASYYVLHKNSEAVATEAESELGERGWKRTATSPAVFSRGSHERIDVRSAQQYNDSKLLEGIPSEQLSSYTIVKVVDPRMPPAFRQRLARWRHPLRRIVSHLT